MSTQYIKFPASAGVPTYATQAALPASASDGALAVTLDTDTLWVYSLSMTSWLAVGSPGSVIVIGTINSQSKSANGAVDATGSLVLQTADASFPGLVSTGTQTFAGNKTFSGTILGQQHVAFGAGNAVDGNPLISGKIVLSAYQNVVDADFTANSFSGTADAFQISPTSDQSASVAYGRNILVETNASATQPLGQLQGLNIEVQHNNATSTPELWGYVSRANHQGGGNVNDLYGAWNIVRIAGASTIGTDVRSTFSRAVAAASSSVSLANKVLGNYSEVVNNGSGSWSGSHAFTASLSRGGSGTMDGSAGFYVQSPSGSMNSISGLNIQDQSAAGSGNYQIFSNGDSTNGKSYFKEKVGFGNTSPAQAIDVTGNILASGTITGSNLSGTNTGNVTLTAVGASSNANGASLSGQALTLQPANTSFPGILTASDWNKFNNPSVYTSHTLYVDTASGSDSNVGGPSTPYATIQAALNAIGSAVSGSDFNNAATAYWVIKIAPGVYTETLTVPTRQYIEFDMDGVQIVGNVSQPIVDAVMTGAIQYTKLVIKGADMRSARTGASLPITGINGTLTITRNSTGFSTLHVLNSGIASTVTFSGVYSSAMFCTNAIIGGNVVQSGAGGQTTLYAYNSDTSTSSNGAFAGLTGVVIPFILNNVSFNGPVVVQTTAANSVWKGVVFKSGQAHDFTSSTATIAMDANTVNSFNTNVPTKGSVVISRIDDAYGVNYTPTTSGDWSVVPTEVKGALDNLASTRANAAGSSTANALATWSGTTGKTLLSNTVTLSSGAMVFPSAGSISVPKGTSTSEAFGALALAGNTAIQNTAVGNLALNSITGASASKNTAIGYNAMGAVNATAPTQNVAIGANSLSGVNGNNNVAIGYNSMLNAGNISNTIAIGNAAGANANAGSRSVYVGDNAGSSNNGSARYQTALGYFALQNASTGDSNIALGAFAGSDKTAANANELHIGNTSVDPTAYAINKVYLRSSNANGAAFQDKIDFSQDVYFEGNIISNVAGKGLNIKEGSNARMGTAVLNGITAVTVSTTAVTANSRIFLTIQSSGGTPGATYVDTRVAGTSFNIKSTGAADTSTVAWLIIEPSA